MHTLAIDIETYSSRDLAKCGVYKYVEAKDFEVLLFACSIDGGSPIVYDLHSDKSNGLLSDDILNALTDPAVIKTAFNASFERTCLSKYLGIDLPADQWYCTMVHAAMLGLPFSLDVVGKVLKLDVLKSATGKALIKYFCTPCKPTKANGGRTRNLPEHDSEKWSDFMKYCAQDVAAEQAIAKKIAFFKIPDAERRMWVLDQKINDTGVLVDPVLIDQAITMSNSNTTALTKEAIDLTQLSNPNSAAQLKKWLSAESGTSATSLNKGALPELLQSSSSDTMTRVLTIRQEMAKTSVKKYEAMLKSKCDDNRIRGLLQYYGANRTGRWAGRLVQVQNLPQNHLPDLDLARQLVRQGDIEMVQMLFGNVADTLSQLIRTAFIARPGHRLVVADFAAIEARVIAWLAGEKWRLDVFNSHGKIYEASASQMFKVPISSVTKGSPLRQKGKVSELALGYQGGPNALINMGALNMGILEEELPKLVAMWRQANPAIVRLWDRVNYSAIEAATGSPATIAHGIKFFTANNVLYIELPSGRRLCYLRPRVELSKFGNDCLTYEGMDQTTKQWGKQDTYGGKLVENIVQAIARDCLAHTLLQLDEKGYRIVMHVHDEVVLEVPETETALEQVNKIMSQRIPWAPGLPLTADSYETTYYKKD